MSLFCFIHLHHLNLPSYQKILLSFGIWSVSEISFLPFVWCKVQRIQCWDGRVRNMASGVRNWSIHVAPCPKHLAPPQLGSSIIREPWLASSSIFKSFPLLQALTSPCGRNGWSAWRDRRRRLREQNTLASPGRSEEKKEDGCYFIGERRRPALSNLSPLVCKWADLRTFQLLGKSMDATWTQGYLGPHPRVCHNLYEWSQCFIQINIAGVDNHLHGCEWQYLPRKVQKEKPHLKSWNTLYNEGTILSFHWPPGIKGRTGMDMHRKGELWKEIWEHHGMPGCQRRNVGQGFPVKTKHNIQS